MEINQIDHIKEAVVPTGTLLINWIGQAGYVLKTDQGTLICIDPYYSNSIERYEGRPCRRMWYNQFKMEFFQPDITIFTHDHLDHTDPETVPLLAAYSDSVFYGPVSSCNHLKEMRISEDRMVEIQRHKTYTFQDVTFETVHAQHTPDSVGILLKVGGLTLYFTGDTSYEPELLPTKKAGIDIIIACINGKYNNLTIEQAVELAQRLEARTLIPTHYGLIPNNTVDVRDFVAHCEEKGAAHQVLDVETNYICQKTEQQILIKK